MHICNFNKFNFVYTWLNNISDFFLQHYHLALGDCNIQNVKQVQFKKLEHSGD
jgi:hypothetical protein